MAVTRELRARIGADASGYRREMGRVGRVAKSTAAGVAAAFAGVLSARAFVGQIQALADYGDELDKMSKRVGIATDDLERLKMAAELSGAGFESVERALWGMADTISDTRNGLAEARRALEGVGVSLEALEGKAPIEQFEMLMTGLAGVADRTERVALARDIFKRSGAGLLPMLAGDAEGFRQLMTEANRFGVMTKENVAASAEFIDSLARLKASLRGIRNELGGAALDELQEHINALAGRLADLRESGDLARFGEDIRSAINTTINVVSRLAQLIATHGDKLAALGLTYAGVRILRTMTGMVLGVHAAVVRLTAATVAETTTTNASAAAHTRKLAALQLETAGLQRASHATNMYAASMGTASRQAVGLSGALNAVAASAAVAFVGWNVGKAIGEMTGHTDYLSDYYGETLAGQGPNELQQAQDTWKRKYGSLDATNLGGKTFSEAWRHMESRKNQQDAAPAGQGQSPAVQIEQRRADAEQELAQYNIAAEALEKLRQEAIVARHTGDEATMELWNTLTGEADVGQELTAIQKVEAFDRLENVVSDNAKAAFEIMRHDASEKVRQAKDAADETARAADRRKQEIDRLKAERRRLQEQLGDMDQTRPKSARLRDQAAYMEQLSEQTAEESEGAFEFARASYGERFDRERAARRTEREERREQRRIDQARERMGSGRHITQRSKELIAAEDLQEKAEAEARRAKELQAKAEVARMREAQEPLQKALDRIDKTLDKRLPEKSA